MLLKQGKKTSFLYWGKPSPTKISPESGEIFLAIFKAKHGEDRGFCDPNASEMRGLTHIYIYAVKLLSGPSLAILGVIIWAN